MMGGAIAMLKKPPSIDGSPFKSSKWDEITSGRNFQQSDAPTIALLCQWYEVIEKCMEDLDYNGSIQVAYQNDLGDIKAFPQLATMKQASAEIRALNKQLGINDTAKPTEEATIGASVIKLAASRREERRTRATG